MGIIGALLFLTLLLLGCLANATSAWRATARAQRAANFEEQLRLDEPGNTLQSSGRGGLSA
jgi:hypothetical protein